ncbi:MAG: hypothetical protein CMN74_03680 [Sphingorhabdus sp.]|nr:hypothetical protein [Sphingorhabdus sp.]
MNGGVLNEGLEPNEANPHSWLVLTGDPSKETLGRPLIMWGTLRAEHRGRKNSLSEFVLAKLMPAAPKGTAPWTATAHRHEVLLPDHAPDHLLGVRTLIEAAEREFPGDPKALCAYATLTEEPATLHSAFELARDLARELVHRFDVAALLVQHVPARVANTALPHVHIVFPGPRRITRFGAFGSYVSDLTGDRGRELIVEASERRIAAKGHG